MLNTKPTASFWGKELFFYGTTEKEKSSITPLSSITYLKEQMKMQLTAGTFGLKGQHSNQSMM